MLLEFAVDNFRSFANEVTLTMVSPKLRTNIPRVGQTWDGVTERVAAIYGANAAGKTTLLEAIWALSRAIKSPGDAGIRQPNANSNSEDSTKYSVDFVASGVRYVYEVAVVDWGVKQESLYSYPKGSRRLLFTRHQEDRDSQIEFDKGSTLTGPTAEVLKITRRTALYLATAYRYNHNFLAPVARALAADVGINFITFRDRQDEQILHRVLVEMVAEPSKQVDLVGALLRAADLGITGVEVREEEVPEKVAQQVRRILEALQDSNETLDEDAVPRLKEVVFFDHQGENGSSFQLPIQRESAGTITWLTTAWHALNALRDGSVLLIDELDASLHPELSRFLVKMFTSPQLNIYGAQLLFTTHDVSLIGNDPFALLRPANIWFVEKEANGTSDVYSLDDFDNRSGNNNARRYLAGRFGAVPNIDDSLLIQYISSVSDELQVANV